jgi:NADH-quinone oxidoreductase subunit L
MTIPLIILALGALIVGLAFGPTGLFEKHLHHTFGFERLTAVAHHAAGWSTPIIGLLAGLLGLGLSYALYAAPSPVPGQITARLGRLYRASLNKFYVDEFYEALVVRTTLGAAKVVEFLDTYLVDGLVQFTAWVPRLVGRELLGPFQNGLVQFYAAVTALGVAGLLWVLLLS